MEAVRAFYLRIWRGLVLGLSLGVIAYLLYFSRLNTLPPGYSIVELNTYAQAGNWHNIMTNPVNAPYKALVWLCAIAANHSPIATRIVSACIGLLATVLFFFIVRAWCTYRAAFLTTVLFATSAGLLHFARLGTGDILQMSVLGLLGFVLWYRSTENYRVIIGYLLVILFVMLWYVPGMIWFELLGLLPLRNSIRDQLRHTKTLNLIGMTFVFLACLAPLVHASVKSPRLLEQLVGLPQDLHSLTHVGANLLRLVAGILAHSNGNPLYWVGHAPLLSAAEVVVLLIGGYYIVRETSGRTTFLLGSGLIGLLLASLGGGVTFACIVPFLYLLIATGIDRFLGTWLTVFPRNPVARIGGISIVCIMLIFSVLYQVRAYYDAWPHAPATQKTFNHRA